MAPRSSSTDAVTGSPSEFENNFKDRFRNRPGPNWRRSRSRPATHSESCNDQRPDHHYTADGGRESAYRGYYKGAHQGHQDAGEQGYYDGAAYGFEEGQATGHDKRRSVLPVVSGSESRCSTRSLVVTVMMVSGISRSNIVDLEKEKTHAHSTTLDKAAGCRYPEDPCFGDQDHDPEYCPWGEVSRGRQCCRREEDHGRPRPRPRSSRSRDAEQLRVRFADPESEEFRQDEGGNGKDNKASKKEA